MKPLIIFIASLAIIIAFIATHDPALKAQQQPAPTLAVACPSGTLVVVEQFSDASGKVYQSSCWDGVKVITPLTLQANLFAARVIFTTSTIPPCGSVAAPSGTRAVVSDGAASPTYHAAYVAGGATVQPLFCQTVSWLYD